MGQNLVLMKFKTFTETNPDLITPAELELLRRIKLMMDHFPDDNDYGENDQGKPVILSCHIIARAVARVIGKSVKVIDGHYFPFFEHSWLETERGNIIDVYPVGIVGGPIFVNSIVAKKRCRILLFDEERGEVGLYLPKDFSRQADFAKPWFKNAVHKIAGSVMLAAV